MKTKSQSFKLLMAATVGTAALVAPVAVQAAPSEEKVYLEDINLSVGDKASYVLEDYFTGEGNTYTFTTKEVEGSNVSIVKKGTDSSGKETLLVEPLNNGVISIKVVATDSGGHSQSKSFLVGVEKEVKSYGIYNKKPLDEVQLPVGAEKVKINIKDYYSSKSGGDILYEVEFTTDHDNVAVEDGVIVFDPKEKGLTFATLILKNDDSTKIETILFVAGKKEIPGVPDGDEPTTENGGDKPTTENGGDKPTTENGGDKPTTENGGDKPTTENGGDKPTTGNGDDKPTTGKGESGVIQGGKEDTNKKPALTEQEKKEKLEKFEAEEKAKEKAKEEAEAKKERSMLPQTGTETAVATGAIGALFLALAAAVGLRRNKK